MKKTVLILAVFMVCSLSGLAAVDIDGKLSPGEYSSSQVLSKDTFTLHWQVEGSSIHFAIEAVAKGWVAIGLDPGSIMARSDMIFGIIGNDGKLQAVDAWCTNALGPHPADTDQGGKADLLASAASRQGDKVVFEFTRLLDTGDAKTDKVIDPGKEMKIIWAYSNNLGFNSKHSRAGSARLVFGKAK
jgi:hypothetical protein